MMIHSSQNYHLLQQTTHIIDVSNDLNDVRALRDKIFLKFNITDEMDKQSYALFVPENINTGENLGAWCDYCAPFKFFSILNLLSSLLSYFPTQNY